MLTMSQLNYTINGNDLQHIKIILKPDQEAIVVIIPSWRHQPNPSH